MNDYPDAGDQDVRESLQKLVISDHISKSNDHNPETIQNCEVTENMNKPYIITMTFDMTDHYGQMEFAYAKAGKDALLMLWKLDEEMRRATRYSDNVYDTEHWRERLAELSIEYNLPEME